MGGRDARRPAIHDRIAGLRRGPGVGDDARYRWVHESRGYAENELPQPQPPVAFGFLKVKPEPCIDET
jgi:hypothetical protein